MWFEDQDQLVRAPTPTGFDRLVKSLEDNDSVMFQSISLPSSADMKQQESSPPVSLAPVIPQLKIEREETMDTLPNDVGELNRMLGQVELEAQRKSNAIRSRDERITALKRELDELEAKSIGARERPVTVGHESVEFYRDQYEKELAEFEALKKSLDDSGKVRRVSSRSARPIRPLD